MVEYEVNGKPLIYFTVKDLKDQVWHLAATVYKNTHIAIVNNEFK